MTKATTFGLTHLAIAVNDVNRTMKFYRQVFDMQIMYHEKGFLQLTTPGCNDILVFEEKKDRHIGQTGGIAHFGFRLKKPGYIDEIENKGEFVPGSPYVFFNDPDGYKVEVWYELLPV